MFIRNAWYAAALSAEIKAELFARMLLNEKVVMYRTTGGTIAALEDRCAHRQVPLSRGRLHGDQVECWYHGMRFEASGRCVHVPGQTTIPKRACVKTFPAVEKHGFVWLWMGDPERRDEALIPDHSVCASPEFVGEMGYCHVNTDYRLGVENILDLSHITYVHVKTIASLALTETTPQIDVTENEVRVRRVLRNEKSSPLLRRVMGLEHIDRVQEVIFWPVGNTRVETTAHPPGQPDGPSLRLFTTAIFTPETETTCHTLVGMHRDFAMDDQKLTEMITKEIVVTVLEDKDVTEQLQANWKQDAPIFHRAVDRAGIAALQMLDRLSKRET